MKKLLLTGSILSLLLPTLSFAASDDVSLSTDVRLTILGITLNISGATALIESIEVGAESAIVYLQSGSKFNVSANALNKLSYDVVQPDGFPAQIDITCTSAESSLNSTSTGATTLTVYPTGVTCADVVEVTSSHSSKGDARGGGGGAPAPQASPVAQLVTTAEFSSMTLEQKQAAIAQIRAALVPLIQQLILLLTQEIQTMQTGGN